MGINRQKQIAQAKADSGSDAEFQAKLITMLLQANDFTNEQLISLIADNKKTVEKSLELAQAVQGFVASLKDKEIQTIINLPKEVSIKNALEIIEPKWAEKLIPNTKVVEAKLGMVIKAIRDKEVAKQVEVINEVKLSEPKWYKPFDGDTFLNKVIIGIKGAFKEVLKGTVLKVTSESPLRVMLVNGAGKAIDMKSLTGGSVVYGGGGGGGSSSGGGTASNVGIYNASETRINPATEETLELIRVALGSLENTTGNLPDTLATQVKQDELLASFGLPTDTSPAGADEDATVSARLRYLNTITYQMMADMGDTKAALLGLRTDIAGYQDLTKKTDGRTRVYQVSLNVTTGNLDLVTPTAGMKLRIYAAQFSTDVALTSASFRNGMAGTDFWKHLVSKVGGLYGFNHGDKYIELLADEPLTFVVNEDVAPAGSVQVNVAYEEVA